MNYERLRRDLLEYFGTATFSGLPMAVIELIEVERASEGELIKLAKIAGFNLRKYED